MDFDPTHTADVTSGHATADANDSSLEWHILTGGRVNALITGPAEALEHTIESLMTHLATPICCWTRQTVLPSPHEVRTLVIRHVDDLSTEQQRKLLSWLDEATVTESRVVSTTTVRLFDAVTTGHFLETLFYRLNIVTWEVSGTAQPDALSDTCALHASPSPPDDHESPRVAPRPPLTVPPVIRL
jgi:Sigma-54 interaction domain